jgi:hypothetical protein
MENEQTPNLSLIRTQDDAAKYPAQYYPPPDSSPYLHELEEDDSINFLDYWRVVVKRRWIILTITMAVLAVAAITTWKAIPIYRSTIKIQIDPEQTNVLPFKDTVEPTASYAQSQEYLQTQFKVLESKTLAARVIKALNLENNESFVGPKTPAKSKTVGWFRGLFGSAKKEENETEPAAAEEPARRCEFCKPRSEARRPGGESAGERIHWYEFPNQVRCHQHCIGFPQNTNDRYAGKCGEVGRGIGPIQPAERHL